MINKEHLRTTGVCLLLALGTALLYAPVLHFDFIKYDDQLYIINNPHVNQGLHWDQLGWCFQAGYASNWHPLTWMSHMLDCQMYGLKAGGHHATNVVIHILNAVLLFLVLRTTTGAFWRSTVVAALFAWHPLHVESVAWVSERKDVLSTLFWMLTIWAYVCYVRQSQAAPALSSQPTASRGPKATVFYCLALLSLALGLMAKPMLVTLPFVLLLLDWWPLGRLESGAGSATDIGAFGQRFLLLFIEKIPFFALSVASCVLTIVAQHRDGIMSSVAGMPMQPRIVNALVTIVRYAKKMIWPTDLGATYPFIGGWPVWKIAIAVIALAAISALATRWRRERPYWLVGWLWFLGTLVPVLGVFQVGSQPLADRYTYIPLIGLFLIGCWDAYDLAGRLRYHQVILGLLAAAILGGCFVVSSHQLEFWRNSETILSRIPMPEVNTIGHANYAALLMNLNRLKEAQGECEQAIRTAPRYAPLHALLGRILLLEGKVKPATLELRAALQLEPGLTDAHLPLGQALLAQGAPDAAAEELQMLIKQQPENIDAHFRLGQALMMQGKFDGASAQFNEVLRLAPQFSEAHVSLALISAQSRKTSEAIAHYQAALHARADYPEALNNLAWILATSAPEYRNGAQAVQLAQRACELTRNAQPALIGTLAAAYAEAGRFDDAIATAQKAHDIALARGDNAVAARNLQLMEVYRAHRKLDPSGL
jgi:protein O-mannosyl-transferase